MQSNIPEKQLAELLSQPKTADLVIQLNAAERDNYPHRIHKNTRYIYPFWKCCEVCSSPFKAVNRYQASRNSTCGKECMKAQIIRNMPDLTVPIEKRKGKYVNCANCGKSIWRHFCRLRRTEKSTCSSHCNGVLRGDEWKAHAHKGRAAWTDKSKQDLVERMTGDTNPAWKGGLTYRKRKGAYANQKIRYVRCPKDFLDMARKDGYVMEHRLIVAEAIGRALTRSESVHHINHDATDNRPENLMLFATNGDHKGYEHGREVVPMWSGLHLLVGDIVPARFGAASVVLRPPRYPNPSMV